MKKISGLLLMGCSALALAGCGADDIASPGNGGVVVNPNPTPTPAPTPTPGTGTVVAADSCPTIAATGGLTNGGVLPGPEGTWRICTLPALIDKSTSLPKLAGVLYRINGRVDVGCDGGFKAPTAAAPFTTTTATCASRSLTADTNVTLTIDPGVILYGENTSEAAWIAVNRGNKINAEGTADKPIIFTARENVVGTASESTNGKWGGIVLLGRGVVTDCNYGATNASLASHTCERDTEGAVAKAVFGGIDNTYNAGIMKYVQIRYSGYLLSDGKELQALTTEGIGSGTTLDYVQSVNSSDDGMEFFGGKVQFKHYIAVNADDDSLDIDTGLEGYFQYVLLLQKSGQGDALMEIDTGGKEEETPRQKTIVANFTAIQPVTSSNNEGSDKASTLIRGNSDITWVNGIINTPNNECLSLQGTGTTPATLKAYSTVMTCGTPKYIGGGSYNATSAAAVFGSGSNLNNDAFTSTLTNTFVNGSAESGVAGYTGLKALSSFFDQVTYIGAVKDAADVWYKGWTCDTATAPFGSGQACTALPTT
ncbi:hypothetical protein [Novosphingobium resinovorum]|uniref:Lipoprotein n=2 Tax=Sphingomonadaceae TaxID=41297 RepID=A0A1D8A4J1_9SPHN|nr:hypothetical protein [Novosphingobium resinovorum]AOR77033.1 hypothetical protein BES08_09920 [Novosphingobium resinovorum]